MCASVCLLKHFGSISCLSATQGLGTQPIQLLAFMTIADCLALPMQGQQGTTQTAPFNALALLVGSWQEGAVSYWTGKQIRRHAGAANTGRYDIDVFLWAFLPAAVAACFDTRRKDGGRTGCVGRDEPSAQRHALKCADKAMAAVRAALSTLASSFIRLAAAELPKGHTCRQPFL